jgi:hypothetical protein
VFQGTLRGATCRVPKDSPVPVSIGIISPADFEKWDSFRNLLIVKSVPLLQKLPKDERQNILRDVKIKRFDDGDVIIREGDVGEEFFIIQEGSVQVIQNVVHKPGDPEGPKTKRLAAMREGETIIKFDAFVFVVFIGITLFEIVHDRRLFWRDGSLLRPTACMFNYR